jgi:hypothetical protein
VIVFTTTHIHRQQGLDRLIELLLSGHLVELPTTDGAVTEEGLGPQLQAVDEDAIAIRGRRALRADQLELGEGHGLGGHGYFYTSGR